MTDDVEPAPGWTKEVQEGYEDHLKDQEARGDYKHEEGIPITFAVSMIEGAGVVVEVPERCKDWFDGGFLEDNFTNPPKDLAPGFYRGTFGWEFHQGYFEGYRADGESDWELTLEKFEKVSQ